MKKTFLLGSMAMMFVAGIAFSSFADEPKAEKKPILKNKTTNPDYDPNKGIMGKPKEEKIIKRTRNEPIIKNRKYEPIRMKNNK